MRLEPLRLRIPDEPRPRAEVGPPFNKVLGGWLCLDFVNTVAAWVPERGDDAPHGASDRPDGDRLEDYYALVAWSVVGGILDERAAGTLREAAAARPAEARAVLERARTLRAALYRIFQARVGSRPVPQPALAVLEEERERLRRGESLEEVDDLVVTAWVGGAAELDGILWPVVLSAVGLLRSRASLDRLRQCEGARCGWLFVDVSRGGRRRWCDMADCGNVAKVRALRARQKGEEESARPPGKAGPLPSRGSPTESRPRSSRR
jgi:predicted RNA-binding Zn ribbon-like protein